MAPDIIMRLYSFCMPFNCRAPNFPEAMCHQLFITHEHRKPKGKLVFSGTVQRLYNSKPVFAKADFSIYSYSLLFAGGVVVLHTTEV